MKKLLLALPVLVAAVPAFAADIAVEDAAPVDLPVAAMSWTGFYAGVQGGYAFGDTDTLELDPFTPALETAFAPGFSGDFDDGFTGGVHVGYDWQFGNVVFGGILDVSIADIGDEQVGRSVTPATYTIARDLDYLVTARARLGYAFSDRFLAYATGGLAHGEVDFNYSQPGSRAAFTTSGDQDSDFGYTVGGGFEARVTEKVSLGFEYLYTNLGGNDFEANLVNGPFGPAGGPGTDLRGADNDFDFHTIQAKLSYRF